jgi:hypothetical protein
VGFIVLLLKCKSDGSPSLSLVPPNGTQKPRCLADKSAGCQLPVSLSSHHVLVVASIPLLNLPNESSPAALYAGLLFLWCHNRGVEPALRYPCSEEWARAPHHDGKPRYSRQPGLLRLYPPRYTLGMAHENSISRYQLDIEVKGRDIVVSVPAARYSAVY